MLRTEAVIDLAAIRGNVQTLRAGTSAEVLAVVKADGYGHGLVPAAQAALAGGAGWLGTATVGEALALRAAGIGAPVLSWLWTPDEHESMPAAVAAGIDISVSADWQLDALQAAAESTGRTARVHLKADTGLSRNGCPPEAWPQLISTTARAVAAGQIELVAVWSHLACADEPGHPSIGRQSAALDDAVGIAERAGLSVPMRHLANSAATLTAPATHFDLVRPGIAVYGLSPVPGAGAELVPAMTLRAAAALVKRVPAGTGVSYGHTYRTDRESTLVLVPLGYADGVARAASGVGPVSIGGRRFTVSGRVCMDQFVVDVGDLPVGAGDEVVLFGPGRDGQPTAQEWADATGTIHYEIVTRIGARVPRRYVGQS